MIEQVFKLAQGDDLGIRRILFDENVHYLQMVLGKDEGPPVHMSNSNVYMTVVRGTLSIALGDQERHEYQAGTMLKIPVDTKMEIKNLQDVTLELIVVKAPAPTS